MQRRLEEPAFAPQRSRQKVSKEDWPPGYRRAVVWSDIDRFATLVGVALGLLVLVTSAAGSPDSPLLPAVGVGAVVLGVANHVLGRQLARPLPTWVRAIIYLLKAAYYVVAGMLALLVGLVVLLVAGFFGGAVVAVAILVLALLVLAGMPLSSLPGRSPSRRS